MAIKIEKKIVAYEVINLEEQRKQAAEEAKSALEDMHENVERPEMLVGATYKIKTPQSEHALYVTINDVVLNHGTEHESRQPFEIFINSKNMAHFQWVVALTRVISAIFRKGGDVTFLADELKAVFDPQGGYFKPGGRFMPSIVAEIGFALESHMKMIGLIHEERMPDSTREMLNSKRAEYELLKGGKKSEEEVGSFPADSKLCERCYTKAVIIMDGCLTCLNCGDSKCG